MISYRHWQAVDEPARLVPMPARAQINPLANASGWVARTTQRVHGWLSKLIGVGLQVYSRSGAGIPAYSSYDHNRAMSAYGTFPWVYACGQAIYTDLSGLPIVIETGTGLGRKQSQDHWMVSLLDRPHPKISGRRLRRQWYLDLRQTGNAYIRVWRDKTGRPIQLGRVPPQLIQPIIADDGEEIGWQIGNKMLPWSDVRHVADPSWEASLAVALGESPMRPLSISLQIDRDAKIAAGRAARRGRVDMLLSPNSEDVLLGPEAVDGMVQQYAAATEEGHGIWVVNRGMTATPNTLTAREGEFLGLIDRSKAETMAVMGVPPTRAGDPAANYGTARAQMRVYWEFLMGLAALFDDELTQLVEPGVKVRHDFSRVEALQTRQTEALNRVVILVGLGMDPNEALRYEQFFDAPTIKEPKKPAPAPATAPVSDENGNRPADEPQSTALTDWVTAQLQLAALVFESDRNDNAIANFVTQTLCKRLPYDTAREAGEICAEAANLSDDGEPLENVRAFGEYHAQRITRMAT